jgi:hypothetical protein
MTVLVSHLMQGKPDLAADFRVLESPDGTVQFDSIVSPGIYLTELTATDIERSKDFTIKTIAK